MISSHKINLPHKILIGSNILDKIGELCQKLGFPRNGGNNRIFLVTGPKTKEIAGKAVKDHLEDAKFKVKIYETKEANIGYVNWAVDLIKDYDPSLVIGVGGGKNIDIAKLSSFECGLPFISVPTTLAHDGVASPFCSLKGLELDHSFEAQTPIAILADTSVMISAPPQLLSAGFGDMISNLTAVKDWRMAHRIKNEYYGHYAALLSQMASELMLKNYDKINPNSEESVRIVLEAVISSSMAMAVAGSSRPASGSEHLFSHALDKIAPNHALHGHQCGVGAIMMMYLHDGDWKEIKNALEYVGAPTTAEGLRIKDETIIKALTIAHKMRDRFTILQTGLTKDAAENLAKSTGVIQ
ncbi:MAG: NAD(P)-dependent glycerol-1-phosphate dehydrogenase [Candidatus Lokiarchaeota archaeon]|nr:NAD(P)-dependent glycerol-1-phosphate dehydrogenase [Candidatus Lokiarchaeota archaeon]